MSIPCNHGHFSRYNPSKPLPRWQMTLGIIFIVLPAMVISIIATVIRGRR